MNKRTRPSYKEKDCQGFTLIDLLVTLVLFSLLTLALLESVRFGIGAWQRTSIYADQMADGLHVHALLRHMIENAYPQFLANVSPNKKINFEGSKSTLNFLTSTPIALGVGGRSHVMLAVEQHGTNIKLVLTAWPELVTQYNASIQKPTILIEGLEDANFSYFGATSSYSTAKWHDNWHNQPALPQLIKIHLQFPINDARNWPDLIAAPKISVDVNCTYDPLTNHCRGR